MKRIRLIFALFTAVLLMGASALTVFANGNVTYDGSAQKFVFGPGSNESPTDLFEGLKGVMPGDSVSQRIVVRNDADNNVKVKLYVRSAGAREGSEDFLSRLSLTVKQNGSSELFAASADQSAGLSDWVCLGTFYSGAEIELDVTLDVPADLGNEFEDRAGYIDWRFKVEELPVESDDPKPPVTGDDTDLAMYGVLAGVSSVMLVILVIMARRRRNV